MNHYHFPRQNEDHFLPASACDYAFPKTDLGQAVDETSWWETGTLHWL